MKLLQPRAGLEDFCVKVFVVDKNDLSTRRLARDEYAFQNGLANSPGAQAIRFLAIDASKIVLFGGMIVRMPMFSVDR